MKKGKPLTEEEKKELAQLRQELAEGTGQSESVDRALEFMGEAGETARDMTVAAASDFVYDFLDEAVAGAAATYEKLAHDSDWDKAYRHYQKIGEKIVNDARERSPIATTIAGFMSPGLGSELAIGKKIAQSGVIKSLAKTAVEAGGSSLGRSSAEKNLTDRTWDAIAAAGVGVAIHSTFKVTGELLHVFAGGKEKVAANMMNAQTKDILKHSQKSAGKGMSGEESAKRLFGDIFDSGLITVKNAEFDPETGKFIQKMGEKKLYPKIGDVEKNVVKAKDILNDRISKVLKIYGHLPVEQQKKLTDDIVNDVKTKLEKKYSGTDFLKANKILNELKKKKIPHVDKIHSKKNILEKLDVLRKEYDGKHGSSYGVDSDAALTKDTEKLIANTLRSKLRKAVPDKANADKLKNYYSKYTDLSDASTGIRKGGVESTTGAQEQSLYPRIEAVLKKAASVIREHGEVPFYDIRKTPPANKFLIPFRPGGNKAAYGETPQRIARELGAGFGTSPSEEETNNVPTPPIRGFESEGEPEIPVEGVGMPGEGLAPIDPREMKIQQLKEQRQKDALSKLRKARLSRNSDEFIQNKELIIAKFAQQVPDELPSILHILEEEPDKIRDVMTVYASQYPELFVNDKYKRINDEVVDNNAKMQLRKEITNREDISNLKKTELINKLNKEGVYTFDKESVAEEALPVQKTGVSTDDMYRKLKEQEKAKEASGYIKTVSPTGEEQTEYTSEVIEGP